MLGPIHGPPSATHLVTTSAHIQRQTPTPRLPPPHSSSPGSPAAVTPIFQTQEVRFEGLHLSAQTHRPRAGAGVLVCPRHWEEMGPPRFRETPRGPGWVCLALGLVPQRGVVALTAMEDRSPGPGHPRPLPGFVLTAPRRCGPAHLEARPWQSTGGDGWAVKDLTEPDKALFLTWSPGPSGGRQARWTALLAWRVPSTCSELAGFTGWRAARLWGGQGDPLPPRPWPCSPCPPPGESPASRSNRRAGGLSPWTSVSQWGWL